jgi:hypothetical protein
MNPYADLCYHSHVLWCTGKGNNELLSRLSALGVDAHAKELFDDGGKSPEEYAEIAREKQIDLDSETFESMEKIKNMLVVS